MAKRYELVSSYYDRGKFLDEKVLFVGSLTDIDKVTCMYRDSRSMIQKCEQFDFGSSNTLSIRYHNSKSYKPLYMHALFDQVEMKDLIDSVHLESFYNNGKRLFKEVIDVRNPFYKKAKIALYDKINSMGMVFLDEVLTIGGYNDLKRFIRNYIEARECEIYSSEDLQNFNDIKMFLDREFSLYLNFRSYLISLKKYNDKLNQGYCFYTKVGRVTAKENIKTLKKTVVNRMPIYERAVEYFDIDGDKEEFLELEEIERSVGEGNNLKGYKGYVKS